MSFYILKSSNKVFHNENCHHIKFKEKSNLLEIQSLEEGVNKGYFLCKNCSEIYKFYKKERKAIDEFIKVKNMEIEYENNQMKVKTIYSEWKILINDNKLVLYHKNTMGYQKSDEKIKGFHNQKVRGKSIKEYLQYIVNHDEYRKKHPVELKGKEKPKKGTRRYKSWIRSNKEFRKRESKRQVLFLLDQISKGNSLQSFM